MNNSKNKFDKLLEKFLSQKTKKNSFLKEVILYSIYPTGKLFRPNLAFKIYEDLNPGQEISDEALYLAIFSELHHTYSLIHDDLPAMDDDDFRRGRLSSHKKFDEGHAILAGDALINLSFEALARTNNIDLIKVATRAMGPKGLILGQALDIHENKKTLDDILTIHELKTSRLIQMSCIGPALLSPGNTYRRSLDLLKYGKYIGIIFQLLDDLSELSEDIGDHERSINPFIMFPKQEVENILKSYINKLNSITDRYALHNGHQFVHEYLEKFDLSFM